MRSFVYFIFYKSSYRVSLIRNLIEVLFKTQGELASKIKEPHIMKRHIETPGILQGLLLCELRAIHKREVLRALFNLVMPKCSDLNEALNYIAKFDQQRATQVTPEKCKKADEVPLSKELLESVEYWQHLIFPNFNYTEVSEDEYQAICDYLVRAFDHATIDHGARGDLKKGLEIEDFALDRLPIKVCESIENKAHYQQQYERLVEMNNYYGSITDDAAISVYLTKDKFMQHPIILAGFLTFQQIAQLFEVDHNTKLRLSSVFHKVGLLFLHNSKANDFVRLCNRYDMLKKNGEIDEHVINTVLNVLSQNWVNPVQYTLPPTEVVCKPVNRELLESLKEVRFTGTPPTAKSPPLSPRAISHRSTKRFSLPASGSGTSVSALASPSLSPRRLSASVEARPNSIERVASSSSSPPVSPRRSNLSLLSPVAAAASSSPSRATETPSVSPVLKGPGK